MNHEQRQQIRRDAEDLLLDPEGHLVVRVAEGCLALLAELEETERTVKTTVTFDAESREVIRQLESRLANVPPLVEVLTGISTYERLPEWMRDRALEALAAWHENNGGNP